jgi:hypothetical protein
MAACDWMRARERLRTEDGQRYNLPVIQSSLPSNSRKPTAHTIGKNL